MRSLLVSMAALVSVHSVCAAELGIRGTAFTIDGKPTFLLGASYYAALGASEESVRRDLAEMKRLGFNWVRVWATWAAFENDASAVTGDGDPRPEFLTKLKWLVAECDRHGFVVDVTLSRGNGVTGPPRLQAHDAHRKAVEAIVMRLKDRRNWYLDLSNERNIKDRRFTSFEDLKRLRTLVREKDTTRLVTASHAGDITKDDVKQYIEMAGVDFLSPHRPRNAKSPAQTESKTCELLAWAKELGREVPVNHQEPFRRGFGPWEPSADDFALDLRGAKAGGAAGWCFHNGDQRAEKDGRPRRSFDLRDKGLFEQLDDVEKAFLQKLEK